jgi:hypothetical protein
MRKQRKDAIYAAEERREKIITWILSMLVIAVGFAIMGVIIYFIGLGQGRW